MASVEFVDRGLRMLEGHEPMHRARLVCFKLVSAVEVVCAFQHKLIFGGVNAALVQIVFAYAAAGRVFNALVEPVDLFQIAQMLFTRLGNRTANILRSRLLAEHRDGLA